jgi:hypothetical protein
MTTTLDTSFSENTMVLSARRGFLHACIFWYCDNFCAFILYFNPIECLVCSRVSTTQTTTISKSGVLKSYDYPLVGNYPLVFVEKLRLQNIYEVKLNVTGRLLLETIRSFV